MPYPKTKSITATLPKPERKEKRTGNPMDDTHCLLCDCSEFRRGRVTTICKCGHHYEDHAQPKRKPRPRR